MFIAVLDMDSTSTVIYKSTYKRSDLCCRNLERLSIIELFVQANLDDPVFLP